MFNRLPTSSRPVLQQILAGILLSEMKTSPYFTFTVFMWNELTWKLVVVAFAFKIFLFNSNMARCPSHHAVLRTVQRSCGVFNSYIRQLETLNKTKIICPWPLENRSLPVWCEDLTYDWLQNKHSRHILGVHAFINTTVNTIPENSAAALKTEEQL